MVATNKVRNDAKTAGEIAATCETELFVEVGSSRNKIGELTMQLRQQTAPATVLSKELAAINAKLKSHKGKLDSMDEELKMRNIV